MRWALIACLAGAGLAVGCDSFGSAGGPTSSADDATASAAVEITGASPEQEALLKAVLAGMGRPRIERVVIRDTEPGDVEVVVEDVKGSGVRGWWDAKVVALSFADQAEELGLPRVIAAAVRSSASRLVGPDEGPPRGACREITEEDAATLAAEHGAELVAFERLQPGRPALALTVSAADGARFLADGAEQLFGAYGSRGCAGSYLEVVDGEGLVWARAVASSDGLTSFNRYVREGLEACDDFSPVSVADPESYVEPPPCPA